MTTVHVTTSPQYLIESALADSDPRIIPTTAKPLAEKVVRWLDANGYGIRENDAPTMTEHRGLIDALAARDLRWADGVLHDGPPEPVARSIVTDADGVAWQRDNDDTWRCAFGGGAISGAESGSAWATLRRRYGPLTVVLDRSTGGAS